MARPELAPVTPIVIPRGRSAAEKRLGAIAALHQPLLSGGVYAALLGPECGECKRSWPCATARLFGAWPGAEEES